jgi:hypothetical protein
VDRYPIHPGSPQLAEHISKHTSTQAEGGGRKLKGSSYPFSQLQVGECFVVPYPDSDEEAVKVARNLRVLAGTLTPHLNMRFKVIQHEAHRVVEVGRIE